MMRPPQIGGARPAGRRHFQIPSRRTHARTPARSVPLMIGAALLAGALLSACGGSSKPASTATSTSTQSSTTQTTTQTVTAVTGTVVSPGVVRATSGGIVATLHATTHKPKVNAAWPISFEVTSDGSPAKAEVRYQYLFGGNVVARRSHYRFTGRFSDIFRWPASSVGYPLTFRAVILVSGKTLYLEYPVKVQR